MRRKRGLCLLSIERYCFRFHKRICSLFAKKNSKVHVKNRIKGERGGCVCYQSEGIVSDFINVYVHFLQK